jgi:hypothetical protein
MQMLRFAQHDSTIFSHLLRAGEVEHKRPFEARDSKDSQRCNTRVAEPTMPSHLRLCGEERKGLMGCQEKPVAHLGVRLRGKIIGLVVEVLIRLRAKHVARTHRIPAFFKRSSNRRCLSSQ